MYFFSQISQASPSFLTKNATKKNRVPLASNDISINGKSAILAIPAPRVNIL
jgi:hypothetical protein